jgi:hypothetical protein
MGSPNSHMNLLPREIHREIIAWLAPEEQQMQRLVDQYWAGLIQPTDVNILRFGAKHNILEYCEIGLSRGNSKKQICDKAAEHGHLEILQWARSQECPWNACTCAWSAQNGHLEVLQWARDNGCPWNEMTCERAAQNGHLEVLKWARSQGCPWSCWTCVCAAENGHLEVIRWAIAQGCPWNRMALFDAVSYERLEILQWALCNNNLKLLRWALDENYHRDIWTDDISGFPQHIQECVVILCE